MVIAMAFSGVHLLTVHTSDSEICVERELIDYIRSLIIASECGFIF